VDTKVVRVKECLLCRTAGGELLPGRFNVTGGRRERACTDPMGIMRGYLNNITTNCEDGSSGLLQNPYTNLDFTVSKKGRDAWFEQESP